ncbi:MAG: hypothetical protein SCARUB_02401 [Candidatus Scalindua rubra]|uniref:Lycopene cyclase domain-containing protein n=1 Tax=Candidatus Scalindua rubra TaxID=1872076 RepID=A0A1E3X9Z7_9BACT|nr:MAG: hypothetical protein SCARUB_02401 [Candidatus Scalindua rubra]
MGKYEFKLHGWIGIFLISFAELAVVLQHNFYIAYRISIWTTPLCWWGYIFLIDAIIFKLKGNSLICNRRKTFLSQLPLSILIWLLFELYNLHLANWKYIGLPTNPVELYLGTGLSFATIMPGIFLTSELLDTLHIFDRFCIAKLKVTNRIIYGGIVFGFLFIMAPLLLPKHYAIYLFGLVWTGFVMLIEPIVYSSNGDSLLRDLENGILKRILSLFTAGFICGILWEFWNFWAPSKWVYTAPFMQDLKIFEMPVVGFLGFGPFAWEYFVMYNFARLFLRQDLEKQ